MSEKFDQGLKVRKEVLGEEWVSKSLENANDFNMDMQTLVTEYCWGEIWTRPGLERKHRSMINISMLAALNRPHELKVHIEGALRNGVTKKEIQEILLQVAIYCGVPAAVDSFRVANEVITDLED